MESAFAIAKFTSSLNLFHRNQKMYACIVLKQKYDKENFVDQCGPDYKPIRSPASFASFRFE